MHAIKTPIYQTEQIREFERIAKERFGIFGLALMQRAGKAAYDFLVKRFPQAQKITVLCGAGNNGGDGYVLAQLAKERGMEVTVWQIGDHTQLKEEANGAYEACKKAAIPMAPYTSKVDFKHTDLIIDAICGIGLKENIRDDVVALIDKVLHSEVPVYALDVPTGINADTGEIKGAAIHATATITFIGLKLGLLTGSGIAYAGELVCSDLQLPSDLFDLVEPIAKKANLSAYTNFLKPRLRDWHKGLSGHVLVVGGDTGFLGAARMAAEATLRVGAGLVSVATCREHADFLSIARPEIMCHGVESKAALEPLIAKADVIVLGPGLGQSDWAKLLWVTSCNSTVPLVVDADALNLLAETTLYSEHWILTPHPGEAARLLKTTVEAVQKNRLEATKAINKKFGGICILKGAGSLIVAPNSLPALCDKGNPGMATGGMGDVLSGVIGGLIAQGIPLGDAAKLGVCLHAGAGDLAAKEGERGMIATDLMPYLRRLVNPQP